MTEILEDTYAVTSVKLTFINRMFFLIGMFMLKEFHEHLKKECLGCLVYCDFLLHSK